MMRRVEPGLAFATLASRLKNLPVKCSATYFHRHTEGPQSREHAHTHTHTGKRPASLKHKHTPCGRGGLASASSYNASPRLPRPLPSNPQQAFYLTAARFPLSSPTLRPPLSQPLLRRSAKKVSPPPPPNWKNPHHFRFSVRPAHLFVRWATRTSCRPVRWVNSRAVPTHTHMQRLPHVRSRKKKNRCAPPVFAPPAMLSINKNEVLWSDGPLTNLETHSPGRHTWGRRTAVWGLDNR